MYFACDFVTNQTVGGGGSGFDGVIFRSSSIAKRCSCPFLLMSVNVVARDRFRLLFFVTSLSRDAILARHRPVHSFPSFLPSFLQLSASRLPSFLLHLASPFSLFSLFFSSRKKTEGNDDIGFTKCNNYPQNRNCELRKERAETHLCDQENSLVR